MSPKHIVALALAALLAACSSTEPPPAPRPAAPVAKVPEGPGPLLPYQREVSGQLLGAPAGAEVEMAMLVVDERGRPQKLLTSSKLQSTGQSLPFQLRFNPEAFPAGARVELRARAIQSGQLVMHLPSMRIEQPVTQALGPLQLVKAP
ncbi:YbaY family lipoprotein [Pseudomonas sp. DTU_2021_1001937_2_SI_NGA_ILE_001]|uniref:YbaY family lipoprotein n=1 Tax=Pseudomonas sp. DTU_2021_1001937_2_SI_NGA_ILE_001 TaxID=3077589 RepID=UPI0025D61B6C|nr:YbaY family lipoprotein [Pseudomonas sp. DTU_2021_1001937_2_SI_NGA_ILE_001]WNW12053.1 YbaY family lipoprotein [Pseudomonas sp. DTU_2021_1001937_2_SI_NGA_ILE_001]